MPPAQPVPETVRILSIDGGGIRGLLPARILEEIETRTGVPIARHFHLMAGTSTGGILACGLAAGKPARDLGKLYADQGGEIFARSFWQSAATLGSLEGPKYQPDALERKLQGVLGDQMLSAVQGVELLVPSYCIQLPQASTLDGQPLTSTRTPMFFKSWRSRGQGLAAGQAARQYDFPLRSVARATSAAPTYFPPARIQNAASETFWMVDGGVFANNPAMCALTSARRLYPGARRFLVLSLGTGTLERSISGPAATGWGLVGWLHPVLSILMDGNADTVCYQVDQELGDDHRRFDTSLGTDPKDPTAVNEDFDDASPDNIARLQRLAAKLLQDQSAKLQSVLDELARPRWEPGPAPAAAPIT